MKRQILLVSMALGSLNLCCEPNGDTLDQGDGDTGADADVDGDSDSDADMDIDMDVDGDADSDADCDEECEDDLDCAVDRWCDRDPGCCRPCGTGKKNDEHCGLPGQICVNCAEENMGTCSASGKCACKEGDCDPGYLCVDQECQFCDQDAYCGDDCTDCTAVSDGHYCHNGICVQCTEDEDCAGEDYTCDPITFTCLKQVAFYDFEKDDGGLAPEGEGSLWAWEAVGNDVAPDDGHGKAWKIKEPGSFYRCKDEILVSPALDLSEYSGKRLRLTWETWYEYCNGGEPRERDADGGHLVEFQNGADAWSHDWAPDDGWIIDSMKLGNQCDASQEIQGKPGFTGISKWWVKRAVSFEPDTLSDAFKFRFVHASGCTGFPSGADAYLFIDNVAVVVGD